MAASRKAFSSILAMDSAGGACSAALWRGGRVVAGRFELMRRGHAERLVPMIEAVMAEGAMSYADLGCVAVTLGPGGFTGVRIGLATARGLALACGRPLVGVSNFLVLAAAAKTDAPPDGSLAVVIDAKRRDLYVQAFAADLRPRTDPRSILPEALAEFLPPGPLVLVGDGVAQATASLDAAGRAYALSRAPGVVDAARLAELVASRELGAAVAASPEPLYLRPPDATPAGAASVRS
ncbi:MAG TPA: tRNA (adenosine(37)-N6)-threonylcarbamoyltransferase complex dimerization subunit type 1 TsaB [Kiloniellales bacterium]